MLTVSGLLDELGPRAGGRPAGRDAPLRWVHISELLDPTPWLSGGELLLTTGLQLDGRAEQRHFVAVWWTTTSPASGSGPVSSTTTCPPRVARRRPSGCGFPLFEVPYAMPFIAITEKAFGQLVNEQYEMLQRGIALHSGSSSWCSRARPRGGRACPFGRDRRHDRVLDRQGDDGAATSAASLPKDGARREFASESRAAGRESRPMRSRRSTETCRAAARPAGRRGKRGGPEAWLVAVRDSGGLGDFERLILQQAVTVVALELMRRRVVRDTERRLAGDILERPLRRAERAGAARPACSRSASGGRRPSSCSACPTPAGRATLERICATLGSARWLRPAVICSARWPTSGHRDAARLSPSTRATRSRSGTGEVRAAASRRALGDRSGAAYHEARYALEVSALRNGDARRRRLVARPRCVPVPALGAGRRGAAHVLRQRARAARGRRGRVRRRAYPVARGVPRAQRPVGGRRATSSTATGTRCATGSAASSS